MTTHELTAANLAAANAQPEWADAQNTNRIFGLSRSSLYELFAEGKIRSASIRKPGTQRGKRLFDCASIRRMIEASIED